MKLKSRATKAAASLPALVLSILVLTLALYVAKVLPRLSLVSRHLRSFSMASYAKELEVAQLAVQRATILTKRVFHEKAKGTLSKDDKSPVTMGDFGAQALIISALQASFPRDEIVAEEEASELREDGALRDAVWDYVRLTQLDDAAAESVLGGPVKSVDAMLSLVDMGNGKGGKAGRIWVIDPIDGTKGFLRGGQYAVCLALLVDGDVKVGVLGCPNLPVDDSAPLTVDIGANQTDEGRGVIFSARAGHGATSRPLGTGALADGHAISVKPLENMADASFCESVEGRPLEPGGGGQHRGEARHHQAKRPDGLAGQVRLRGPRRRRHLLPPARVRRVPGEDLGPRSRRPHRPGGRRPGHRHAGQTAGLHHGRTLAENKGVVAGPAAVHGQVLRAVQEVLGLK